MSITGTLTISGSCSGQTPQKQVSQTAGSSIPINEAISAGQTDLLFNISWVNARLKMLYLVSDVDLTIESNDGTTPGDTLNLLAGEPVIYYDGGPFTNPFVSADVTKWYITNVDAANLEGFILHDPTA